MKILNVDENENAANFELVRLQSDTAGPAAVPARPGMETLDHPPADAVIADHARVTPDGCLQPVLPVPETPACKDYPAAAVPEAGAAAWPPRGRMLFRGNGETVLVVEDDVTLSKLVRTLLTRLNFKVLAASNGAEALLQVAEYQAELRLVITDVHMPNMDGLEFAHALKASLPQAGIIVTSGNIDAAAAAAFQQLGVVALLEKPFEAQQLVALLQQVFK
ncbi:MAG: response regulator [Verrucomicrobiae bacterium]|nr:response regulator [Verrucomicrobiae bacterium]